MCKYVLIFICLYVKIFICLNVDGFYLLCCCCCCHDWKIDTDWYSKSSILEITKKNSEFSLQLRVYKGTRDVTAVGQFQGFPHKTDLVQTSEIPKTAFPLIPHLSSCIKALKSETKQIEWQTVHDIWSVNHTVWFKFTEENLTKCGSVEVIIGISQSYKFCWMSLGILISWNQEDK